MDYGYKITTHGRALLMACAAMEKPLTLTRVAVGGGKVAEGTNLADVHGLINYIADGSIGERTHESERLYVTIQYDNSAHQEVPLFYLSEFMVYAADPETGEETDLIYATLGDNQQPVPAYNAALPASVFSFPLVLIVSDEIEVSITAAPGLVTHDDLQRLLNEGVIGISRMDITIPADTWVSLTQEEIDALNNDWTVQNEIAIETVKERMTPELTLYPEYLGAATSCGLSHVCRTVEGALRVYAHKAPSQDLKASLTLVGGSGYIGASDSADSGAVTEIPVATKTTLGGIKASDSIVVEADGTAHAAGGISGDSVASDDDVDAILDDIFGSEP
jgi:hypothetical protein